MEQSIENIKLKQAILAVFEVVKEIAKIRKVTFSYKLWIGNPELDDELFTHLVRGIAKLSTDLVTQSNNVVCKIDADSYGIELFAQYSDFQQTDLEKNTHLENLSPFSFTKKENEPTELSWHYQIPRIEEAESGLRRNNTALYAPVIELEHFGDKFFNFEPLMLSINNNLDALHEIIVFFLEKFPQELQQIKQSLNLRDRATVALICGRLKAACEYMGLRLLEKSAGKLGKMVQDVSNYDDIENQLQELENDYFKTSEKMNKFLKEQGF